MDRGLHPSLTVPLPYLRRICRAPIIVELLIVIVCAGSVVASGSLSVIGMSLVQLFLALQADLYH